MSRRGLLLFLAMSAIWGIPYLLIKVAVRDVDPATLVFARTTIGAVVLAPLAVRRRQLRPTLARWRPLVVYTVVELAVPWVLLGRAEERLPSSLTGLLVAAVPLVGAGIAWGSGRRSRLGPQGLAGLIVGLLGVALLVGFDVSGTNAGSMAIIAAVVVGYALGPAIVSRSLADAPPLGVAAGSLALCALGYLPYAMTHLPTHVPPPALASVLTLGLVCTALAFVLFFALIAEVGPVRATVFTYVNPAVALLLGVGFLHERFTTGTAAGFALIITGSFLATRTGALRAAALTATSVSGSKSNADLA